MGLHVPTATTIWRGRPDVAENDLQQVRKSSAHARSPRFQQAPHILYIHLCKTSTVRQISGKLKIFHAASASHQSNKQVWRRSAVHRCAREGKFISTTRTFYKFWKNILFDFPPCFPSRHWSTHRQIMLRKTLLLCCETCFPTVSCSTPHRTGHRPLVRSLKATLAWMDGWIYF